MLVCTVHTTTLVSLLYVCVCVCVLCNHHQVRWQGWLEGQKEFSVDPRVRFSDIIVPTMDTLRSNFMVELLTTNSKPVSPQLIHTVSLSYSYAYWCVYTESIPFHSHSNCNQHGAASSLYNSLVQYAVLRKINQTIVDMRSIAVHKKNSHLLQYRCLLVCNLPNVFSH